MARILTFSSPATGHALPLVPGLRTLAARGHDVHLRVDAASLDLVRGASATGGDGRSSTDIASAAARHAVRAAAQDRTEVIA